MIFMAYKAKDVRSRLKALKSLKEVEDNHGQCEGKRGVDLAEDNGAGRSA